MQLGKPENSRTRRRSSHEQSISYVSWHLTAAIVVDGLECSTTSGHDIRTHICTNITLPHNSIYRQSAAWNDTYVKKGSRKSSCDLALIFPTAEHDLAPYFQQYGYVSDIRIQSDRGFAFVKQVIVLPILYFFSLALGCICFIDTNVYIGWTRTLTLQQRYLHFKVYKSVDDPSDCRGARTGTMQTVTMLRMVAEVAARLIHTCRTIMQRLGTHLREHRTGCSQRMVAATAAPTGISTSNITTGKIVELS